MSIEADLNKPLSPIIDGIKRGESLSAIGREIAPQLYMPSSAPGYGVSRQRVWQILKEKGLHDLWKKERTKRRRQERLEAEAEKRDRSSKYQKIMRGVKPYIDEGYMVAIEKEGSGWGATIEGAVVAVHETSMDKLNGGGLPKHDPRLNYFHIRSVKPYAIQILVFSDGDIYTIPPPGADKPVPCSVYVPKKEVECNGQVLFTKEQFQKIAKEQSKWKKRGSITA